jgi:Holliday junction resolvase RusA-like endonuclease
MGELLGQLRELVRMIAADPVTVVLLGEPVAWARTRISSRGVLFTPSRQRNNAAELKLAAQQVMANRLPFDCPVRIDLQAEFLIPSSWSRQRQSAALRGEVRPGKRPDLSNLCKQVEDALNTVVFKDDALIVEYGLLRKVYSRSPKLVVTVRPA